jgi:DNA-directed RNA polymerase beta subunit
MEQKTAVDSGVCVIAKADGKVEKSTATNIVIKREDGTRDEYKLIKSPDLTRVHVSTRDLSLTRAMW